MTSSLHIALVTETWRPEINGVAMTLGRLTDGLRHLGHRFTLTRPRQHAADLPAVEPTLREVLVAGCPIPGYRGLRFGLPAKRRLLQAWREDRPDILQVATEGPLGASAIAAAKHLGIPVVSEFHTNFHAYSHHYGAGWLEGLVAGHLRRLHNKSAVTLAPTFSVAEELRAAGYRSVRVVARGIDTALFNPQRRSSALRARWGVGEEQLVVAYVGRLAAEKNLPLVLRAFKEIRAVRPDARLLFVGDGPLRASLERDSENHLFAGMRQGEDLAMHYASADLFLFPSLTETFGNVTTEAMASGCAVVAFESAAAGELIRSGMNGWLAGAGKESDFVAAVRTAALDPVARRAVAEAARATARRLDWGDITARFESVLESAIARGEPAYTVPGLQPVA